MTHTPESVRALAAERPYDLKTKAALLAFAEMLERPVVAWMDADGKVMSDSTKLQLMGLQPWNVEPYQTPLIRKDAP